MAPKKATDKVTKPKATPEKGRRGILNAASPSKDSAKGDQNLLFLWSCFESTGTNPDIKLVAEAWGLKINAARMRYARLKAYIEKIQQTDRLNQKSEDDEEEEEEEEEDAAGDQNDHDDEQVEEKDENRD